MIHKKHACNYRLEICPNNKRNKDTLIKLIKKLVVEGTEILDCWRGYSDLEEHDYVHRTVNHSEDFVDSNTDAHTQNILLEMDATISFTRRSMQEQPCRTSLRIFVATTG